LRSLPSGDFGARPRTYRNAGMTSLPYASTCCSSSPFIK
jgi:hypothetical protein